MRVTVRLHGTLRRYLPPGSAGNVAEIEIAEGSTAGDVLASLGIPPAYAKMVVSGEAQLELSTVLTEHQEINVFPPLAGGC